MIKDIPASVARVVAARGAVYLRTTRAQLDQGLSLEVGGQRSHFEEVPEDGIAAFGFPLDYRPEFDVPDLGASDMVDRPPEASAADGTDAEAGESAPAEPAVEAMLNALDDWTLEDHATLQLKVRHPDAPARFAVAAPITLPPHGKDLHFSALLAGHRAGGRLHVAIEDPEGRALDSFEFPFDEAHHGGRHIQGYKQVVRPLPPCSGESVLRLSVLFDRNLGTAEDAEPYFFVADPHVLRKPRPGAVPAEELHTNPGATGQGVIWTRAPVPAVLAAGDSLDLIVGDTPVTLMTGADTRIALVADYGHTLMLEATETGRYHFHIDGAPAFEAFVGTEPTAVRLPGRFFNGETRSLSAWDRLGVQRLFLTHVLMPRLMTPIEALHRESRPPYPLTLSTQAAHRFAGVRAQMARGLDAATLEQVSYALSVLEGGHGNVSLQPLFFPEVAAPDVSVVIPAHNKVEVTYFALASLLVAANDASFEVIVVDDASSDATSELELLVEGITVLHNPTAERFIRACNAGVAAARGRYVVLLNNDTEVTAGWLDALIDAFERVDDVGLVGSKLVYPDGTLQDAGGIVWGSGNPWQYGNGQNPHDPRFCYARQADYLSGAAMMTTKAIWDEVGGLSSYLEPMYFEDTDFAFKLRAAGYTTWFVPASVVYHYEGMTSGTDTGAGFKRFQELNRPKFKRRWAAPSAATARTGSMSTWKRTAASTGACW